MPIFVMHVLIVEGIRIAATHLLHLYDLVVILMAATVSGLLIPSPLFDAADRFGFAAILALE